MKQRVQCWKCNRGMLRNHKVARNGNVVDGDMWYWKCQGVDIQVWDSKHMTDEEINREHDRD